MGDSSLTVRLRNLNNAGTKRTIRFLNGNIMISPIPSTAPESTAVNDSYNLANMTPDENGYYTLNVLSNDIGEEPKKITRINPSPTNGTSERSDGNTIILYKPDESYVDSDSLGYRMRDKYKQLSDATVTISGSLEGGGSGAGGPLRQAIYSTMIDSIDTIDTDIETDTEVNNPNSHPALKLLMYNKVFDHLANASTDEQSELDTEERTNLLTNVVPKFQTLYNDRIGLESGSDNMDTETYNTDKNALKDTMQTWIDANPDDNPN